MKETYYASYSWEGGRSFRVYRIWFFESIVIHINQTLLELEADKENVFLESLRAVK